MGTILHAPQESVPYAPGEPDFEFRKIHWDANGHGARCIKGELINRTQRSFDWIRVQFTLYNSVDAVIGVTSDLIIGCASEAVWKFRAPVFDEQVTRASLPIVSTEFGRVQSSEQFGRRSSEGLAECTREPSESQFAGPYPYANSITGKARVYASASEESKPVHWSQVRK